MFSIKIFKGEYKSLIYNTLYKPWINLGGTSDGLNYILRILNPQPLRAVFLNNLTNKYEWHTIIPEVDPVLWLNHYNDMVDAGWFNYKNFNLKLRNYHEFDYGTIDQNNLGYNPFTGKKIYINNKYNK